MMNRSESSQSRGGRYLRVALVVSGVAFAAVGSVLALRRPAEFIPGSATAGGGSVWLENVASQSGIDFRHVSGAAGDFFLPEIMSGGVGLLDFDRDGYLDAYFVQGGSLTGAGDAGPGNRLFRNLGDGTFEDVTEAAGVGDRSYGVGCACGDFDSDGWPDIYVTNVGANVLYRNNRDGTFSDVTAVAGVGDPSFSVSAAFVDYDNDGALDLFVVNYVAWSPELEPGCKTPDGREDYCKPTSLHAPAPDTLYHNNGDGTFSDVSRASGISRMFGNGLGIVCGDFNGDGLVDIGVANDLSPNQLWINRGNGTFKDEALVRGMAYSGEGAVEAGMGIDARDIDGDGDLDVLMTHFSAQTNTLYVNDGGFFVDQTTRLGLMGSLPFTGFGTALVDLNNDGELDVYVANGRVVVGHGADYGNDDPYAEPNQLFEGVGGGAFREVMPRGGTARLLAHSSRAAAFGDYDNDGDIDIFVVNRDAAPYLLRNRVGQEKHWVTFRLVDRRGADAMGARVSISVAGRTFTQDVRTAYSYGASNDPRVHFGLGSATRVDRVEVVWMDGSVRSLGPIAADQFVTLEQAPADVVP